MRNRLARSGFEAYRREFGYVVGRNRRGAPKAQPGPAARPRLIDADAASDAESDGDWHQA